MPNPTIAHEYKLYDITYYYYVIYGENGKNEFNAKK